MEPLLNSDSASASQTNHSYSTPLSGDPLGLHGTPAPWPSPANSRPLYMSLTATATPPSNLNVEDPPEGRGPFILSPGYQTSTSRLSISHANVSDLSWPSQSTYGAETPHDLDNPARSESRSPTIQSSGPRSGGIPAPDGNTLLCLSDTNTGRRNPGDWPLKVTELSPEEKRRAIEESERSWMDINEVSPEQVTEVRGSVLKQTDYDLLSSFAFLATNVALHHT